MVKAFPTFVYLLIIPIFVLSGCSAFTQTFARPESVPEITMTSTNVIDQDQVMETLTPSPSATPQTPTETSTPSPSPMPTELPIEANIAYLRDGELVVSHISSGKATDTIQFTEPGIYDLIMNIKWSPSGEYLSYMMTAPDHFPHVFLVKANDETSTKDLGISSGWGWSPDSKTIVLEHEYEIWLYNIASGKKTQLTTHLGVHWLWYHPRFAPDGKSIIVAGTNSRDMDGNGKTLFGFYRIPLDGSAAGFYPPGNLKPIYPEISGRMPLDVQFSPDGKDMIYIFSEFVNICRIYSSFQIFRSDNPTEMKLVIPSMEKIEKQDPANHFYGDSMVWDSINGGLWLNGLVTDCSSTLGVEGGPQVSHITSDGQEKEIIPGDYTSLSIDRTGNWLGVVNRKNEPRALILGLDGHLVLDLGPSELVAFQP